VKLIASLSWRPGRLRLRRAQLGALAAFVALVTAGTVIAPSTAYAGCCEPRPPITYAPCSTLGPIDWWYYNQPPPYVQSGVRYIIVSWTPVFEPAHGRFIQNTTNQTFTGTWTATETRTVTFQTTFTLTIASKEVMSTSITLAASVQVVQTRTTQLGVSATAQIPPHSTMLGEYGLQSLDVVMDVQTIGMLADRQTCAFVPGNVSRHTAHAPTINEGWRFTLY
jgi:hypothetical protein